MRNLSKRSKRLFGVAILCLTLPAIGTWAYQNYRIPISGGPSGDGFFATLRKRQIQAGLSPEEAKRAIPLTTENANGWYSVFAEPVQSFELYQSQSATGLTSERKVIVLQPLGDFNAEQKAMFADMKTYCEAFFQLPVRVNPTISLQSVENFSRPSGYLEGRRQFDAGKIFSQILEPKLPADAAAYLGITMEDIYTGNLSFTFGLATWQERVGIYSLARYFPKKGGELSAIDKAKALRRACQVLNHETGHMFGISHCTMYKCSMNGSNSLSDSDQSPLEFCPVCLKKIEWNLKIDMKKRDAQLQKFYREHGLTTYLVEVFD